MTEIQKYIELNWAKWILFVLALVLATAFLLPMVYAVLASVKSNADIQKVPLEWLPESFAAIKISNFWEVLKTGQFPRYFLNSAFVSIAVCASSLVFCSLAGYSLSKFTYFGRKTLFFIVLMTLMIPLEVTFIPMVIIVRKLGMMNSYWGLIVPVMITPFGIFWMRQFIMTIPDDYAEAARIDGLNEWQIFWRIIFPICRPALAALAIFAFMSSWNSLIWPLIVVTNQDLWTIPVGLVSFQSEFFTPLSLIFAAAILAVLPTVILFVFVRRQLITGLGASGLK